MITVVKARSNDILGGEKQLPDIIEAIIFFLETMQVSGINEERKYAYEPIAKLENANKNELSHKLREKNHIYGEVKIIGINHLHHPVARDNKNNPRAMVVIMNPALRKTQVPGTVVMEIRT